MIFIGPLLTEYRLWAMDLIHLFYMYNSNIFSIPYCMHVVLYALFSSLSV